MKGDELLPEYIVRFRPGVYRYVERVGAGEFGNAPLAGKPYYVIGRYDTQDVVGFAFEENAAKQIVFALNLVNAYLSGATNDQMELWRAIEKLKGN